jgi:hypothetical protein
MFSRNKQFKKPRFLYKKIKERKRVNFWREEERGERKRLDFVCVNVVFREGMGGSFYREGEMTQWRSGSFSQSHQGCVRHTGSMFKISI